MDSNNNINNNNNIDTETNNDIIIERVISPSITNDINVQNQEQSVSIDTNRNQDINVVTPIQESVVNDKVDITERFKDIDGITIIKKNDQVIFVPAHMYPEETKEKKKGMFEVSSQDMISKGESYEFPNELPENLSCTPFLKSFFSCYSPTGFIRNYYRYGGAHCEVETQNFKECSLLTFNTSEKRQIKFKEILKSRADAEEEFYRTHVWKRRFETGSKINNQYFGYNQQLENELETSSPDNIKIEDSIKKRF